MKAHKHWAVKTRHDYGGYCTVRVAHSKEEAVELSHEFFLSYGFEFRDKKLFDSGNDDGGTGGWDVFSEVKLYKGKVLEFTHAEGEGPICEVQICPK